MSDRSCQITPASELIAQANSSALATVFSPDDKTILLFATISEHCSSYAAVIDIIVKEWEPAAVAFGFPPIKAVMFHAHYPKFNPQAYGGPFDQTANSHHLSKSPYLYALYPHGAAEDAIGALAHIQADGHIPRATVTIVQESGPWNPIVTSKAFTALYYLFSVSSLVAATFTIALVGYNAWCQGWQWDYRVALVLIGTGYSAIRIAIPNICDLTVVQDVFLQISFILGNFAYVIFATIW
ncbi:hypothetical protein IWQ60_003850 [Tieghemiomyces parasiticus]|uniref:Uncharacterized protein n=1 Tax=Tieghemiomyces parasiticus TaxID=78921 RepID=A0A9W8A9H5_9FUNG|nr:hypothetical protein IWQ60_003850 [Tieghemiomyces parasiticus]